MDPPTITGVSSTSIKVSWVAPLSPNGALKYYIVTLFVGASTSGTVVYNGTSTSTVVNGLSLKITYGATVTFYNSVGSVTSIAGTGQTTTNNNGFTVQPSILIVCIAALLSSVFVALYDH